MKVACVLLLTALLCCHKSLADEIGSAQAIQIISPNDHVFNLELDEIKSILDNDLIKDRGVVVVSIAGAFRQGKSFLLNFFVKYLYAQYKKHDVTDWIGENDSRNSLTGFKWRSGRKRETTGIWMWSEVFTHDFSNGEKVAIILLDTQGIFDDQSTVRDCTTIFALSMMLSSVQCYNLMQNIKEDDLQHLELFTEYGRLALEDSNSKPFQKLLFIVRDWPYAFETNYGWHGQKIIDEILAGNGDQSNDMRQLRRRIDSSFEDISAFLMPYPGSLVARGNNFTGNVQQIAPDFRKYVKELVRDLFAPSKLILKKINGEKVRVRDLIPYLQAYLKIFNGDDLPESKTVFMATAEASMQIILVDCVKYYVNTMQALINEAAPYFSQSELVTAHQNTKSVTIELFQSKPKLGGDRFDSSFQKKLETEIEQNFVAFNETNEEKYKNFADKARLHNEKICAEILDTCERKLSSEIEHLPFPLKLSDMNTLFSELKQAALEEFNTKKMGDDAITNKFREQLQQDLDGIQSALVTVSESYNECLKYYSDVLQKSIGSDSHQSQNDLIKLHQNTKIEARAQFEGNTKQLNEKFNSLTSTFYRRIENEIEAKLPAFEQSNRDKEDAFIEKAKSHNEVIVGEIKAKFENKVLTSIGGNYLNDDSFINLFMTSKLAALDEFASRKMGDGEVANSFRERLERDIDSMQASLKQSNEANKPPPPPPPQQSSNHDSVWEKLIDAAATLGAAAIGASKSN